MQSNLNQVISRLNSMAKSGHLGPISNVEYVGRMDPAYPREERVIHQPLPWIFLPRFKFWWELIWRWIVTYHHDIAVWLAIALTILSLLKE